MTRDIACPSCGERERLRGERERLRDERERELIVLACDACGHRWERDPRPTCPGCGGADLVEAPQAVVEKVRGNQMSIVGYTKVQLCRACDAALISKLAGSNSALPPDVPVRSRDAWHAEPRRSAGPEGRTPADRG